MAPTNPVMPARKEDAEVCIRLLIRYHRHKPNYYDFQPDGPPINKSKVQQEISRLKLPYCRNDSIEVPNEGRVKCECELQWTLQTSFGQRQVVNEPEKSMGGSGISTCSHRITLTCKEKGNAPRLIMKYPDNGLEGDLIEYKPAIKQEDDHEPFTSTLLRKGFSEPNIGYKRYPAPTRVWGTPTVTPSGLMKIGEHSLSQDRAPNSNGTRDRSSSFASCSHKMNNVIDVDSYVPPTSPMAVVKDAGNRQGSKVTVKREEVDDLSVLWSPHNKRTRWDEEGDPYVRASKRFRSRTPPPPWPGSKSSHPPKGPRYIAGESKQKEDHSERAFSPDQRRESTFSSRYDYHSRTEDDARSRPHGPRWPRSPPRSPYPRSESLKNVSLPEPVRNGSYAGPFIHPSRASNMIQSPTASKPAISTDQPQDKPLNAVETSEKTESTLNSADITALITTLHASKAFSSSLSSASLPTDGKTNSTNVTASEPSSTTATSFPTISNSNASLSASNLSQTPIVPIPVPPAPSHVVESKPLTAPLSAGAAPALPAQPPFEQYPYFHYGYPMYPPYPYPYGYPPPNVYSPAPPLSGLLATMIPNVPAVAPVSPMTSNSASTIMGKDNEPLIRVKEEPTDGWPSLSSSIDRPEATTTTTAQKSYGGETSSARMLDIRTELVKLRKEIRERAKREKRLVEELAELNEKYKVDFVLGEVEEVDVGKLGLVSGLDTKDGDEEDGDSDVMERPGLSATETELQTNLLILQAQLSSERSGRRKADQDRRDAEHAKREAEHAKDEAEHRRSEAERALREAELRCRDVERAKEELEHATKEAEHAHREAVDRRREAEQLRRDAEHARREAEEQRKYAEKGKRGADYTKREIEDRYREAEQTKRDVEYSKNKLEEQLAQAESARKEADRRRWAAEAIVEDIKRECREPFIVPALLDAFLNLSNLSNKTAGGPPLGAGSSNSTT
ncbi:hypothetical protein D9757_005296 [Collybiopsis confluens]|uniref:Uncharacterized protein n=1 Tax=Collybiopsis confluens TaxID=2823264 RepID=A0A8H5HWF9_9AGAR|nr:hypothetical protein D9757_005296 [Collybiopsis confluens]